MQGLLKGISGCCHEDGLVGKNTFSATTVGPVCTISSMKKHFNRRWLKKEAAFQNEYQNMAPESQEEGVMSKSGVGGTI